MPAKLSVYSLKTIELISSQTIFFVVQERGLNEDEVFDHFGIDGGKGFLKLIWNPVPRCDPNNGSSTQKSEGKFKHAGKKFTLFNNKIFNNMCIVYYKLY